MSKIIICISGAVAAYNMPVYIRKYHARHPDDELICVVSNAAEQFVSLPVLQASCTSLLLCSQGDSQAQHVLLMQNDPTVLLCPATADRIARATTGLGTDLMDLIILISGNRTAIFPSMNAKMRHSTTVKKNISILKERGYPIIEEDREAVELATNKHVMQPSMPSIEEWEKIVTKIVALNKKG